MLSRKDKDNRPSLRLSLFLRLIILLLRRLVFNIRPYPRLDDYFYGSLELLTILVKEVVA